MIKTGRSWGKNLNKKADNTVNKTDKNTENKVKNELTQTNFKDEANTTSYMGGFLSNKLKISLGEIL